MGDKQFSILKPDAWMQPGEAPSRIMIDCWGGDTLYIEVTLRNGDRELVRFEWSDQFGPMPTTKSGAEKTSIGAGHPFWRAASLWNLQGRRVEGNRAIWHEPRKPVFDKQRVRGGWLITKVIDPGEPGHDW